MPTSSNERPDSRLLLRIVSVIGAIFAVVVIGLFFRSAPERSAEACVTEAGEAPKRDQCMACHVGPHRDGAGYVMRRVDARTGVIRTVSTNAHLRNRDGIVRDALGTAYAASPLEHAVWRRGPEDAAPDAVAGASVGGRPVAGYSGDGGPALGARMNRPSSVALDRLGRLYIADTLNNRARIVEADGSIHTVAGNGDDELTPTGGKATETSIGKPFSVAFDANGDLLIAHGDGRVGRVLRMDAETGVVNTIIGGGRPAANKGDGGPADEAVLKRPVEVTVDEAGDVYVAESRPILRHWHIGACAACHRLP